MGKKQQRQRQLAARRARKKHSREVARKAARAEQRRLTPPPAPVWPESPRLDVPWRPHEQSVDEFAEALNIHPYQALRRAEMAMQGVRDDPGQPRLWWAGEVAALSTEVIVAYLNGLGISAWPARFREHAVGYRSAWTLSRQVWHTTWLDPEDADFAGAAAFVLWQRWCPDLHCVEQLLEPLEDAWKASIDDDAVAAVTRGVDFWTKLRSRMSTEERCHLDLEGILGEDDMLAWLDHLCLGLEALPPEEDALARRGAEVLVEWLLHFDQEPLDERVEVYELLLRQAPEAADPVELEDRLRQERAHDPAQPRWALLLATLLVDVGPPTRERLEEAATLLAEGEALAADFAPEIAALTERLHAAERLDS